MDLVSDLTELNKWSDVDKIYRLLTEIMITQCVSLSFYLSFGNLWSHDVRAAVHLAFHVWSSASVCVAIHNKNHRFDSDLIYLL